MPQATLTPLPPTDAIAALALRGRRLDPTFSWQDAWEEEHAVMFTVAKSAGFDILRDIHEALTKSLAEGTTFEDFAKTLKPTLQAKGWWGRKEVTDPATGEVRERTLGSTRRLRTIFETNMRVSYAVGHWENFERNSRTRPYLRYVSLLYGKDRRKAHVARHGLCLPVGDPYWDRWAPPCGWGCQCTLQSLSARDVERMRGELTFTPPPETIRPYLNRRTGEVTRLPDGIDPGWGYNPGKAGWRARIRAVPETEADVIRALTDRTKGGGSGTVTPPPPPPPLPPPPPPPPPKVYPAVDRAKTRPVHPNVPGGLEDGDYIFGASKRYPEGITIGDFVRGFPQGEKAARRILQTDYKAGRIVFERRVDVAEDRPADPSDARRITRAEDWHRVSFGTADPELARVIASVPLPGRIEPISGRGAFAQALKIHMDGYETRADAALSKATWRHEYGHHLDAVLGTETGAKWASSSPEVTSAMRSDFAELRASPPGRHDVVATALRRASPAQIDAALTEAGLDLTYADLLTIVQAARIPKLAGALIARDARAYLMAAKGAYASDVAEAALGFTSDAIEAISKATIGGRAENLVGHGAAYYRRFRSLTDGYTEGNGAEAWANYIALRGSRETTAHYRALRHLAPSTAKAFDAMVRRFR